MAAASKTYRMVEQSKTASRAVEGQKACGEEKRGGREEAGEEKESYPKTVRAVAGLREHDAPFRSRYGVQSAGII